MRGGQTKNLTYQLSWLTSKSWHVYSKELEGGLCKACVLFDENSGSKLRGRFVKTAFQDVGKSEKISEHESKDYHIHAMEKAKAFIEIFEDPTKNVLYDRNADQKREKKNIENYYSNSIAMCVTRVTIKRA